MADDSMRRRRQRAAAAFIARRGELGLSQEELAKRADVAYRTVQNFEHGVWPNPVTRARLEKALGWPPGEIHRLASPPQAHLDVPTMDRLRELSDEEREFAIEFLQGLRDADRERRRQGG